MSEHLSAIASTAKVRCPGCGQSFRGESADCAPTSHGGSSLLACRPVRKEK